MKAFLSIAVCLVSFNAFAREFVHVEERCQILGYQEDIDTPRFELPKIIELAYSYTYVRDTLEVVRKKFSVTPDPSSRIPLSPALKDSLVFEVEMKAPTHFGNIHFSAFLKPEDLVNLIQHLASNDLLQLQDPLEVEAILPFSGGFNQFLYPEGYFFNFVHGLKFQAHLPLTLKNGLSYHILVTACERTTETPSLSSLTRPGSQKSFAKGDAIAVKSDDRAVDHACHKSVVNAVLNCPRKTHSKIVHQKHRQSLQDNVSVVLCQSIVMCE